MSPSPPSAGPWPRLTSPAPADQLASRAPADQLALARAGANRRRALALAGAPSLVVLVVAFLVAWALSSVAVAVVAAVVLGVLAGAVIRANAGRLALALVGARPVGPDAQPRVHNLLDGLCAAAGVAKPSVHQVDHGAPNALVVGTDRRRANLVVTTGLAWELGRIELEAVLAHELARVKAGDVVPASVAVVALGPLALLGPVGAGWVAAGAGGTREGLNDLAAVSLTRYPPGLVGALTRVRDAGVVLDRPGARGRATAHLWLAPPGPGAQADLDRRIAALQEL